jgi:hypothetical protein
MLYKDGRIYKGTWENDQYEGVGILKVHPGSSIIIEGRFEEGQFIGG